MVEPSRTYDAIKLGELITNYLNGDDYAGIELSNQVITGEELLDGLTNVGYDPKEKEELKKLVKGLEELVKGKDGSYVDKIKSLIQEYKPASP